MPDGAAMAERPTLILLHGAPGVSDHSSFKPLFGRLADTAQVIYLDLRGCGRSEAGPPHDWTLEQWADDLRSFSEALGIDRPIVLGQSGGGFVAIVYAARHRDHVGKLILASTQARVTPERIVDVIHRRSTAEAVSATEHWLRHPSDPVASVGWQKHGLPLYNHRVQDPDAATRVTRQLDTWRSFAKLWYEDRRDLLPLMKQISCPTLILHGDDDPICPIDDAHGMLAALRPGIGRLEQFERCGHGVWRDHPEAGLHAIRTFIS